MRRRITAAVVAWLCVGMFCAASAAVGAGPDENEVLKKARSLEAAKQLEEANDLLSEYVRGHPRAVAVLVELGQVQLAQVLSDDAMRSFSAALAIDPRLKEARSGEVKAVVASALADRKAGDNNSALSALVQGLKLAPDSVELLLDFGVQADGMQIYVDADKALTHAHELQPDNAKVLYALAHVELDEQKMALAETHLEAYLRLRPEDATAYYGLGHLLHMLDKEDEARKALGRSIALEPGQTASHFELGEIALQAHEDADAKREYERVLSMDPRHGGALTGMGVIAFRAKDYAGAEKYLRSAVAYAPEYVKAHQFYAMTLERLGMNAEAKQEFAQAQSLAAQQAQSVRGFQLLSPR
jgi:tetratricopeptide (TPR) repeat protein